MAFSILQTIRALAAPDHRISCAQSFWRQGVLELRRRGRGCRESGAFLLGQIDSGRRRIIKFVYYDDLDPHCLDKGYVDFDGRYYGKLWDACRKTSLIVVADVHTHPKIAKQSPIDQRNPMIGQAGHVAILIPNYAQQEPRLTKLGVYEYLGNHQWAEYYGSAAFRYFYIGI